MNASAKAAKRYADQACKDLSNFLRRQRGDMTYTEFAKVTGFDPRQLARWERGHVKRMGIDDLEILVKTLNCCLCDVFPADRTHHHHKKP